MKPTAHRLSRVIPADEIAKILGLELIGGPYDIHQVAGLPDAGAGDLSFAKRPPPTPTDALLISDSLAVPLRLHSISPRLDFVRALRWIRDEGLLPPVRPERGIDPAARVSPRAIVHPLAAIGAHTVVEDFAVVHENVRIGQTCHIRSHAVIGAEGFGFERDEQGRPLRFPHIGGVVIGDEVEVGAHTCVDRGTLGTTRIGDHTKLDHHVHVGHNCVVGASCLIISGVVLCGGVSVADGVWVGPNAVVHQHKEVAANARIGIGANVLTAVPAGATIMGYPGKLLRLPESKENA